MTMTHQPPQHPTIPAANGGTSTVTEGAHGRSLSTSAETNQAALSAQATAMIQARYVMADRRPRSWADVRVRILNDCERPAFAKAARYRKPIGKGVEGPSIRFAEACMRYAGNMSCDSVPANEDRQKRTLLLTVVDYETNAAYSATVTIPKTVERRDGTGRVVVGERTNSSGQKVFIVEATEDELLNQQNALISKAARTLILRLIPGDIIEEGQMLCMSTLNKRDATDPTSARREVADGFAFSGVMPRELETYLGHPFDITTAKELQELRSTLAAINDGETTWAAVMEAKFGERKEDKPSAAAQPKAVADKIKGRTAATKAGANPQTGEIPMTEEEKKKAEAAEREPGID